MMTRNQQEETMQRNPDRAQVAALGEQTGEFRPAPWRCGQMGPEEPPCDHYDAAANTCSADRSKPRRTDTCCPWASGQALPIVSERRCPACTETEEILALTLSENARLKRRVAELEAGRGSWREAVQRARREERERCAGVADRTTDVHPRNEYEDGWNAACVSISDAIRALGEE